MSVTIDYLIPAVRLRVGDYDPDSYRYADEWVLNALILAVKTAQRYWRDKYYITDVGVISRNEDYSAFFTTEDVGVIEDRDEPVLILLAAIIILEGSLENSAWNLASWRDAEISFSNLESGRAKDSNLKRLIAELNTYVTPPNKRLVPVVGGRLPGYGDFEKKGI